MFKGVYNVIGQLCIRNVYRWPGLVQYSYIAVLYHTPIYTIRVYAYGMTIRVWYGLLYHTRMVHMRPLVYIVIVHFVYHTRSYCTRMVYKIVPYAYGTEHS